MTTYPTGGKLAVVRRPHNEVTNSVINRSDSLTSVSGKIPDRVASASSSIASAYMHASLKSPDGVSADFDLAKHETYAQKMGSRWIEETAEELWKGGEEDVEWDSAMRSKLLRPTATPNAHRVPDDPNNDTTTSVNSAQEKKKSGAQEPPVDAGKFEGPEMLQQCADGAVEEEAGMPLHLMPGNGTGDEILDRELREQGVRFTGDDRPFGMPTFPTVPVKHPTHPKPTSFNQSSRRPVDFKDAAAAAEDVRNFDQVYQVRRLIPPLIFRRTLMEKLTGIC